MLSVIEALFARRRVLLTVAIMMSLLGLVSWLTMPREEDPRLADRVGILVTPFPGATASMVERLVVSPLEDELFQVAEVMRVRSTARAGVAVLAVELHGYVTETEDAWDEVDDALKRARIAASVAAAHHHFSIGLLFQRMEEALTSELLCSLQFVTPVFVTIKLNAEFSNRRNEFDNDERQRFANV